MRGIYLNEDSTNFFATHSMRDMCEEGLKRQIDYYTKTGGVGIIIFCGNAMRASFDSNTFEPFWYDTAVAENGDLLFRGKEFPETSRVHKLLCTNLIELFRNVEDPFGVRYRYCHERNVDMWISMRMNDAHATNEPEHILHSELWRNHPEFRRALYKKDYVYCKAAHSFDYQHREVRDHHMKLVEEYLERFEMDGFELDWMRTPPHFRPGFSEKGKTLLTEFMREVKEKVRKAEKRWGHGIRIGVRVPSRPEEALYSGLDVFAWADEGLVDLVVPSPYFQSSESELPVEIWRRLLPAKVELAPCLEINVCPDVNVVPRMMSEKAIDCGFAASYYHRGADNIYLFNHMTGYGFDDKSAQQNFYLLASSPENLGATPRRHVVTFHESKVEGLRSIRNLDEKIPPSSCHEVLVDIGEVQDSSKVSVLAGFAYEDICDIEIYLNTCRCEQTSTGELPRLPDCPMQALRFSVPEKAAHDGKNLIDLVNAGESEVHPMWLELCIEPVQNS